MEAPASAAVVSAAPSPSHDDHWDAFQVWACKATAPFGMCLTSCGKAVIKRFNGSFFLCMLICANHAEHVIFAMAEVLAGLTAFFHQKHRQKTLMIAVQRGGRPRRRPAACGQPGPLCGQPAAVGNGFARAWAGPRPHGHAAVARRPLCAPSR